MAPLIQRYYLTSQFAGTRLGALLFTGLFERGERSFASIVCRCIAQSSDGLGNRICHVLAADQHIRELSGTSQFRVSASRRVAELHQTLVLGG